MQQFSEDTISKYVNTYTVPSRLTVDAAWEKLEKRIQKEPVAKTAKVARLNFFVGSVAASLVFVIVLYTGMFKTGRYSPELKTAVLQTRSFMLPDSSELLINSNSMAKFHYNKFTGNRNVVIDGEVFFNIRKGKRFKVDFDGGSIKVLGTMFNVVAYTNDAINVECVDGLLIFTHGKQSVRLGSGEGVKVNNGKLLPPYRFNNENYNERLEGIYYWEKISLSELFTYMGHRFAYSIKTNDSIASRNFTGTIDLSDLHNGLNIVSYAMDLKCVVNEDEQTITIDAKTAFHHN